jgi:hypothetical protein
MSDPRLDASKVRSEIGLGGSEIGRDPSLDANIYVTELGLLRLILYWQAGLEMGHKKVARPKAARIMSRPARPDLNLAQPGPARPKKFSRPTRPGPGPKDIFY